VPDADHGSVHGGATHNSGKLAGVVIRAGDAVRVLIGGGGGWGDPLERDLDAVVRDVRDGLYSPDYAQRAFGVALAKGVLLDDDTRELRLHLAAERDAGRWSVPPATPADWVL
jgi:N-methylhydantoinase B